MVIGCAVSRTPTRQWLIEPEIPADNDKSERGCQLRLLPDYLYC